MKGKRSVTIEETIKNVLKMKFKTSKKKREKRRVIKMKS